MSFDYSYWEPFSPQEVAQIFSAFAGPWCIAGGWGLDLFLNKITREHADIDVIVLREDQPLLFELFQGFEIFVVDPPGSLRPWKVTESLSYPLYNIWIREKAIGPWKVQVMLQDHRPQEWLFRRDHLISGPLDKLVVQTNIGIPVLSPDIQLLYKGKDIRTKDQQDFQKVLPYLEAEQSIWLGEKIRQVYGKQHPWLEQLLIS